MVEALNALTGYNAVVIGNAFRQVREARGLTQQEIAGMLGIARTSVVAIEKGDRHLRANELMQLLQYYGLDLQDVLKQCEALHAEMDMVVLTPAQKRVLSRILNATPNSSIALLAIVAGLSLQDMEEMACSLLHRLIAYEEEQG